MSSIDPILKTTLPQRRIIMDLHLLVWRRRDVGIDVEGGSIIANRVRWCSLFQRSVPPESCTACASDSCAFLQEDTAVEDAIQRNNTLSLRDARPFFR
jgi:hypothetical protein